MRKNITLLFLLLSLFSFSYNGILPITNVFSDTASIYSIPDAPTAPVATASNTQASVAFTAPASNGSAITGYTVTSSPGGFTATGTTSPIVVTGLTAGTSYTFTVVATNAAGNSLPSAASVAVTIPCGAFVASGVWKQFACYNLGATDTTSDPNVPIQGIHGNYYQWGISTVVADASTAAGAISGWNTTTAANGAWLDASKTANDPCPIGYRVPTNTQWSGVTANNTITRTGSWANDGNFTTAISFGTSTTKTLTLPAAGYRSNIYGTLGYRGYYAFYWSSTENGTDAWNWGFNSSSFGTNGSGRTNGLSVRCISDSVVLSNPDFDPNKVMTTIYNQSLKIVAILPITKVSIYNVSGLLVTEFEVDNQTEATYGFNFSEGIYIAKIKMNNGFVATKKLINKN